MNVVVIAAHPDDELLGAGGTLAKHARAGDTVHAVICSEGASSRYPDGMESELEAAGRRAAAILGLASLRFLRLPDQRLDTLPLVEVVQRLETALEEFDPAVVYTHAPGDINADHGVVARAVRTACRPYRFPRLRRLAAFETPSSSEWGGPPGLPAFTPNLFADISATLDVKIAAFECYASEVRPWPHPRSARGLRDRAATWGSMIGRAAAEPFLLLRETD